MQENQFFKKITNKDEISIKEMTELRSPFEYEHEYISKKVKSNSLKALVSTLLWIIVCSFFTVMYLRLWHATKTDDRNYFLVAAIIFGIMICVSCYRYVFVDVKISKIVNQREYRLREVKIHHVMPGIVSIGRTIVKVNDEKNVYSYEFNLNKHLKKIYKNNPDVDFTVIEFDREKQMYGITYIGEFGKLQNPDTETETYSLNIA